MLVVACLLGAASHRLEAGGVTVITHGFNGNVTDWIIPMADRLPLHPGFEGGDFSCYQFSVQSGGQVSVSWLGGTPPLESPSAEFLIKLDWASLSGLFGGASSTTIANAASGALLSTTLIPELGGRALAELPIHLIGHSRGGSVVTEMARVLGEQGVWVDQVTTLDPRPVGTLGDAAVATYENVLYADNFWQNMGDGLFVPNGQALAGAYNRKLLALNGGYSSSHSDVHLWYHGTIDLTTPATDTGATISAAERGSWWTPAEEGGAAAGFRHSRIGGGDRLSDGEPAGGGTGRIRDGFNTHWDLGGGVADNRTPLSVNSGLWPNPIRCRIMESAPSPAGQPSFDLELYYQSGVDPTGQVTFDVLLDPDRNPWNGNEIAISRPPLPRTGPSEVIPATLSIAVDSVPTPPGLYGVCVRLGDGTRRRSLYAATPLEILPDQTPPSIDPESFRITGGLVHFTVLGFPEQSVAIMATSDFVTWARIATRTLEGERWDFIDPDSSSLPRRFYTTLPIDE